MQAVESYRAWPCPEWLRNDLRGFGIPENQRRKCLSTGWQFTYMLTPEHTDPDRYAAVARLVTLITLADYAGDHFDSMLQGDPAPVIAGIDMAKQVDILFGDLEESDDLFRELYGALVLGAIKTRKRRHPLLRPFVEGIGSSPEAYFAVRGCEYTFRASTAASVTMNGGRERIDMDVVQAISEIAILMYDAAGVAKHRAEGEVSNFYAYAGHDLAFRQEGYAVGRAMMWELAARWASDPIRRRALFVAQGYQQVYTTMPRYRFVEDGLTMNKDYSEDTVEQARAHEKLWYRFDPGADPGAAAVALEKVRDRIPENVFHYLSLPEHEFCTNCVRQPLDGSAPGSATEFGGTRVCDSCRERWREYARQVRSRWADVLGLTDE
jgi:hypothetical protein